MKPLRSLTIGSALLICLAAGVAAADPGRAVTGELVDEGGSQFRIVGAGHYSAPSGFALQGLDGKNVEVELSSNGKVMSIREVPVAVNPVAHGWSTVRGELRVTDPVSRTFTFASDTQTYVAPPSIDIAAYNGKMVEVKVDEAGRVSEIQLVGGSPQSAYNVPPIAGSCMYEGQTYSAGAAVCQSGTQYRCDGTRWQSLGNTCRVTAAGDAPQPVPHEPRSCVIGDATVANASSVCRSGITYRCDDGVWMNVQTPCR